MLLSSTLTVTVIGCVLCVIAFEMSASTRSSMCVVPAIRPLVLSSVLNVACGCVVCLSLMTVLMLLWRLRSVSGFSLLITSWMSWVSAPSFISLFVLLWIVCAESVIPGCVVSVAWSRIFCECPLMTFKSFLRLCLNRRWSTLTNWVLFTSFVMFSKMQSSVCCVGVRWWQMYVFCPVCSVRSSLSLFCVMSLDLNSLFCVV